MRELFGHRLNRWAGEGADYLWKSRRYIWFIVVLFFASAVVGFAFPSQFGFLDSILKDIARQAKDLSGIDLIVFIFNNNVKSAFIGLVLGGLLGIVPFVNALLNGVILGYVFRLVWNISGFMDFWRILPHGIFELPAVFIALGLGVKFGMFIFAKNKTKTFFYMLKNSVKAFVFVVIPLLIVAAVIEGLLITFL